MTTWQCILSAELQKPHSFRLFFVGFAHWNGHSVRLSYHELLILVCRSSLVERLAPWWLYKINIKMRILCMVANVLFIIKSHWDPLSKNSR